MPPNAAAGRRAPTAIAVNEGQTLNVGAPGVLGNDTDANANPLTAVLIGGVATGTLALQPDGSFSFTPPARLQRRHVVHVSGRRRHGAQQHRDGHDHGQRRQRRADGAARQLHDGRGHGLSVGGNGVLGNDTDPDGDTLTAELVGNVTNGTLQLTANGSFVYTPPANFNGTTSFTYRARDAAAQSAAGHGHDHGHGRQRRAVHHEPAAAADSDRGRHVPLHADGHGSRRHDADDQRADASEPGSRSRRPRTISGTPARSQCRRAQRDDERDGRHRTGRHVSVPDHGRERRQRACRSRRFPSKRPRRTRRSISISHRSSRTPTRAAASLTYAATSGVPAGLSLSAAGRLSGTPQITTSVGTHTVRFTVDGHRRPQCRANSGSW